MLKFSIAHAVSLINLLENYKTLAQMYRLLLKQMHSTAMDIDLNKYQIGIATKRTELLAHYGITREWVAYVNLKVYEGYNIFDSAPFSVNIHSYKSHKLKYVMTQEFYNKFTYAYYKLMVKHKRHLDYFVSFTLPIIQVHLFRHRNKTKNQDYKQKYLITKFRRIDYYPLGSKVKVNSKLIYPELFYTNDIIMESLRILKHSYIEHLFNPYSHFKYRTHIKVIHSIDNGVDISNQLTADYHRDTFSITNLYKNFIKNSFMYLTKPK